MRLSVALIIKPVTRLGIQPGAVRPANRLERKRKDEGVPNQNFKIHVVVLNFEVTRFRTRIREKLLKLDFDRLSDVDEASTTGSLVLRVGRSRHENALVNGFQAHIDVDFGGDRNAYQTFAPVLFELHNRVVRTHLTRVMGDVAHTDAKGARPKSLAHHEILPGQSGQGTAG